MNSLKNDLIQAEENGELFSLICSRFYSDRESMIAALSELHNSQTINLITHFRGRAKASDSSKFFTIKMVFEKLLPTLVAPVIEVADCVQHLVLEAGNDLSAPWTIEPFIAFCQKDSSRSEQLFDYALDNLEFDHVSTALIAGMRSNQEYFLNKALQLLKTDNPRMQQRAIFALGLTTFEDEACAVKVASHITDELEFCRSDMLLASGLRAIFNISRGFEELEILLFSFIENRCDFYEDNYIYAAASILTTNNPIPSKTEDALLALCSHSNFENQAAVRNLDIALKRLIDNAEFDRCVLFLENFLKNNEYKCSINIFEFFTHALLVENHHHLLSQLLTKWFLAKNFKLAENASDLFSNIRKDFTLNFDLTQIVEDSDYISLIQKSLGWFFLNPNLTLSLIGSLIPKIPEQDLPQVKDMLLNILGVSYPSSVSKCLKVWEVSVEKNLSEVAIDVLSQLERYQQGVSSAFKLKEMRSSLRNRHAYSEHQSKQMNESMQIARENSLLSTLLAENQKILLYGNKLIQYGYGEYEDQRQEVPLHEFSVSMEVPILLHLDPEGLEDLLFQFRRGMNL